MNPIDQLTQLFERFPGIGPRQARRFVQFLLVERAGYRNELAEHIRLLASQTSQCGRCYRWFAKDSRSAGTDKKCSICSSTSRDAGTLFIVEKDADIENVERSGFRGLYFVLGGTIPLAADEPERHIRLIELLARLEADASSPHIGPSSVSEETHGGRTSVSSKQGVALLTEVILGLSATTEGDHTRQILQEKILPIAAGLSFKLSSLGRGLSTGSELEYADPDTIESALKSRS